MTRQRHLRSFATGLTVAAIASLVGCAHRAPTACGEMPRGKSEASILVLTDIGSPAFKDVVNAIATNPSAVFSSGDLGLEATTGTVIEATYDANGQVHVLGVFNLAGVDANDARRALNARDQAACVQTTAATVPASGPGGNLLRALPSAATIAASYGGSKGAAVLAFGLSRSGGDGFDVATADLGTTEARTHALDELGRVQLIPKLPDTNTHISFQAPAEGVVSGISAAGIDSFAGDFCMKLAPTPCAAHATFSLQAAA